MDHLGAATIAQSRLDVRASEAENTPRLVGIVGDQAARQLAPLSVLDRNRVAALEGPPDADDPGGQQAGAAPEGGSRAVNFSLIAEQLEGIGQFYAAFPAGHTTASAALQRLNCFYAANRELGRVFKTELVLQYMAEPQLCVKGRRGVLKVERLHALARAVYYGNRDRINAREVYDRINACSCRTLILACIIYWQPREISRLAADPLPLRPGPEPGRQPYRVAQHRPLRRDQAPPL